jgi:dihydrolipoamide dehydrogenase
MKMGATAKDLGHMIHAHPTLAEALMEAAEDVHKMAIHSPKP